MIKLLYFTLLFALLQVAFCFWRMPCMNFPGSYRIDPLTSLGNLSKHSHSIHGSAGFGFNTTYEDLTSACTSCGVEQDQSAYWTPTLMFLHPNGTVEAVPQRGGMLAYYLLFGEDIQAFPPGFQMISGDSTRRNFSLPVPDPPKSFWTARDKAQTALAQKALGFNCLNYDAPGEPALDRHVMPEKDFIDEQCDDGLRLEVAFPSCWNGEDLDSDDHKSHVAFSSLVFDGTCPPGFTTRIPTVFFETIFWTPSFHDVPGQFVLSNGDPTGYGYHGDFIAGWDENTLQDAIDTCTNLSGRIEDCEIFTLQDQNKCTFHPPKIAAVEDCGGPREGLCGDPEILSGPEPAISRDEPEQPVTVPPSPMITETAFPKIQSSPTEAPSHSASYVTEYLTIGNKVYEVLIEEYTVTQTATVFDKRSLARHWQGRRIHGTG